MQNSGPGFFRQKLLIDIKLQLRLIFHTILVIFLTISVYVFYQNFSSKMDPGETYLGHQASEYASLGFAVLALGLILLSNLFLAHQIVGPIYRLKKHMKELRTDEEIKSIAFRKGDQFEELADVYNRFLETHFTDKGGLKR